jgi:fatty-acyl-CoA synthase
MAGALVEKELFMKVTEVMGAKDMTIAYGLTEASPVTHQVLPSDPIKKRMSSVGNPIQHTKQRIVDPGSGMNLSPGEVGEIWVKGFQVMKGYYKKPEETALAIDPDGWLKTGDLGYVDEGGFLHISGRLKEMVIVGGHNVYPTEVEQAIHPMIEEWVEILQIVGIPHPKLQEQIAAVVKCRPDKTITLEQIKAVCDGKLEWPKIPRKLKIVENFDPWMTVTGKIQKFRLREMLEEVFV